MPAGPRRHCPPECVFKVGSFVELDLAHVLVLLRCWPGRPLQSKTWGGHPMRVLHIAVCECEPCAAIGLRTHPGVTAFSRDEPDAQEILEASRSP